MIRHIRVTGLERSEDRLRFSHVVAADGLLFLSGVTGTDSDGSASPKPAVQFELAFEHLRLHLEAASATLNDVVELTTYHINLRDHLDTFIKVKDRYIVSPFPAWTAIGVSELITPGTLVELRAIALEMRPSKRRG